MLISFGLHARLYPSANQTEHVRTYVRYHYRGGACSGKSSPVRDLIRRLCRFSVSIIPEELYFARMLVESIFIGRKTGRFVCRVIGYCIKSTTVKSTHSIDLGTSIEFDYFGCSSTRHWHLKRVGRLQYVRKASSCTSTSVWNRTWDDFVCFSFKIYQISCSHQNQWQG